MEDLVGSVVTCSCGLRTTEPYLINGEKLCAVCAEQVAPRIVSARAARNWTEYAQSQRRATMMPKSKYARSRYE